MRWANVWRAACTLGVLYVSVLAGCGSPSVRNQPDWARRRVILVPGVCMRTSNLPPPPALPLGLPVLPKHPTLPEWLGCSAADAPLNALQRALETFPTLAHQMLSATHAEVAIPEQNLRAFSYDATSPTSYTPTATRQPLDISASALEVEFKAWHRAEPTATFDLVGHSLGGDVVLLWATKHATPDELRYVHAIVTMDAPVQGYPEPLFGYLHPYLTPLFGDVAGSLGSGSATMQALAAAPALWQRGPGSAPSAVYNAGNIRDLVVPAFIATLSGAGGLIDDYGTGPDDFNHGAVLQNISCVSQVAAQIQNMSAPVLAPTTHG
jgi:hypothetical protein